MINPRAIDLSKYGYEYDETFIADNGDIYFVYADCLEGVEHYIDIIYDPYNDTYSIDSMSAIPGKTTLEIEGKEPFTMEAIQDTVALPINVVKHILNEIEYACLDEIKVKSKRHIINELGIDTQKDYDSLIKEYYDLKALYNNRNGDYTFCLKRDYSPDFIAGCRMPNETQHLCAVKNLSC